MSTTSDDATINTTHVTISVLARYVVSIQLANRIIESG